MDELLKKITYVNASNVKMLNCIEIKLLEEMSELSQAILKGNDAEHIIEEVADVRIMLSQYTLFLHEDDKISAWEAYKLARTKKRLDL